MRQRPHYRRLVVPLVGELFLPAVLFPGLPFVVGSWSDLVFSYPDLGWWFLVTGIIDTQGGVKMEKNERQIARAHLVKAMLAGQPWQEAGAVTAVLVKRAMAYRLLRAVRTQGPIALQDRRQGHPSKLRGEVRAWLETSCRAAPHTPSSVVQTRLQERFDVNMSISQINRVRRHLGVSNHAKNQEPGKKRQQRKGLPLKESGRKGQETSCS